MIRRGKLALVDATALTLFAAARTRPGRDEPCSLFNQQRLAVAARLPRQGR